MKKILVAFLFLLGAAEIVWMILAGVRRYSFEPMFSRAFGQLTDEQMQVFRQFQASTTQDWNAVLLFGIATILIAIFF